MSGVLQEHCMIEPKTGSCSVCKSLHGENTDPGALHDGTKDRFMQCLQEPP